MNLYEFLGITKEQYETHIVPFMDETFRKVKKVDAALLAIETNPKLSKIETIYCAYQIGVTVGQNPGSRTSYMKKIMGLELKDK